MKWLLWPGVALVALFWTGLVAVGAQLSDWLAATVASGQAVDLARSATQWPVPAWLALWVDPAWVQALQAAWLGTVQWLGQVLPSGDGLMGWIAPLLWIGWGLVMLLLLVCAVAGHWLAGRLGTPAALRRAQA